MNTTTEIWSPLPGHETRYEISDWGQVRSALTGKTRKFGYAGSGYLTVGLRKAGTSKAYKIHHLVAAVFIGPRPDGSIICHNNGIKTDNRASNLRYGSHIGNNRDTVRHGNNQHAAQTQCIHGHEFTPENTRLCTRVAVDGDIRQYRACRECARSRAAKHAAKRRAAHRNLAKPTQGAS